MQVQGQYVVVVTTCTTTLPGLNGKLGRGTPGSPPAPVVLVGCGALGWPEAPMPEAYPGLPGKPGRGTLDDAGLDGKFGMLEMKPPYEGEGEDTPGGNETDEVTNEELASPPRGPPKPVPGAVELGVCVLAELMEPDNEI